MHSDNLSRVGVRDRCYLYVSDPDLSRLPTFTILNGGLRMDCDVTYLMWPVLRQLIFEFRDACYVQRHKRFVSLLARTFSWCSFPLLCTAVPVADFGSAGQLGIWFSFL